MSSATDEQQTRDAKKERLAFLRAKQAGLGTANAAWQNRTAIEGGAAGGGSRSHSTAAHPLVEHSSSLLHHAIVWL